MDNSYKKNNFNNFDDYSGSYSGMSNYRGFNEYTDYNDMSNYNDYDYYQTFNNYVDNSFDDGTNKPKIIIKIVVLVILIIVFCVGLYILLSANQDVINIDV